MKKFTLFLFLISINFSLIFSSDSLKRVIRSDIEKIVRDSFKKQNEEDKEKYFYEKILKLEFKYGHIVVEEVFPEVIKDMNSI